MKKLLLLIVLLYGITFTAFTEIPKNGLFTELSRGNAGEYTLYTLKSNQGVIFDLIEKSSLSESRLSTVQRLVNQFGSFRYIKSGKIRIVNNDNSLDCHISASSIKYKDKELMEFIPGGLSFYYKDNLRYDINIISKELRVRIQGEFFSEDKLLGILERASARPAEYLQMQDPEYIMRKFNELKNENKILRQSLLAVGNKKFFKYATPVDEAVLLKVLEEKQNNPELSIEEILEILKQSELIAKKKEIQLIYLIYFGEVTE